LEKFSEKVKEDPNYDEFDDYRDVYMEIAGYLADQIKLRGLPREKAINMCFSLLINQLVLQGVCPACEFYEASNTIHNEMSCPDVI
jgi:hypothetical protein